MRGSGMIDFVRRHWVAYLIAAVVAVVIGFGASYVVGVLGSTPEDAHVEASADGAAADASQGSDASQDSDASADSAA